MGQGNDEIDAPDPEAKHIIHSEDDLDDADENDDDDDDDKGSPGVEVECDDVGEMDKAGGIRINLLFR